MGGDGLRHPYRIRVKAATQALVTVERRPDAALISVTGEIDLANAKITEQQILQGIGDGLSTVTLDLTGLRYIDSAGLWILFRLGTALTTAGIAGEVVVPADGPIRRMVDTAGVAAVLPVRAPRP